jgi:hypothetical protein
MFNLSPSHGASLLTGLLQEPEALRTKAGNMDTKPTIMGKKPGKNTSILIFLARVEKQMLLIREY